MRTASESIETLAARAAGLSMGLIRSGSSLASFFHPRARVHAVKRNLERFPVHLTVQVSDDELQSLKSQIATSSYGGLRHPAPYAFTDQSVARLSSGFRSKRVIPVNIEIMRALFACAKCSHHMPTSLGS
ncbi:MAG: ORF6N domain-containing protein [Candidatus Binataceae bacterium]